MEKFLKVIIDTPLTASRVYLSFNYTRDTTVIDVKKMIVEHLNLQEGYENKLRLVLSGKEMEDHLLIKDLEDIVPKGLAFHVMYKNYNEYFKKLTVHIEQGRWVIDLIPNETLDHLRDRLFEMYGISRDVTCGDENTSIGSATKISLTVRDGPNSFGTLVVENKDGTKHVLNYLDKKCTIAKLRRHIKNLPVYHDGKLVEDSEILENISGGYLKTTPESPDLVAEHIRDWETGSVQRCYYVRFMIQQWGSGPRLGSTYIPEGYTIKNILDDFQSWGLSLQRGEIHNINGRISEDEVFVPQMAVKMTIRC